MPWHIWSGIPAVRAYAAYCVLKLTGQETVAWAGGLYAVRMGRRCTVWDRTCADGNAMLAVRGGQRFVKLPEKGPLYRISVWLCTRMMDTRMEKKLRRKLRGPLCALHPLAQADRLLTACYTERIHLALLVLCAGVLLTLCALFVQPQAKEAQRVTALTRNAYGEGDSERELQVTIGDEGTAEPFTVLVSAQAYTQEELEALFKQCAAELETCILGRNASLDAVTEDLELVEEISGTVVSVWWQLDDYSVMRADGTLITDALTEEGTIVELRAHLTAQEQEYIHVFSVCVKKKALSQAETLREALREEILKLDMQEQTDGALVLPTSVEGESVQFETQAETKEALWPTLLGLTVICAVLVVARKQSEMKKQMALRKRQMQMDYPEIVSKLALLFGAGLTVREAWGRIVESYIRQCGRGGRRRYAYEEMVVTYREMQGGMTELEAYDRFARRCALGGYLKLGALLVQNIKKGTRSLMQLLQYEGVQAMEERKNLAKRMGEEAGTKLLIPMVLMLGVVLLILVVPAFLTIQM